MAMKKKLEYLAYLLSYLALWILIGSVVILAVVVLQILLMGGHWL